MKKLGIISDLQAEIIFTSYLKKFSRAKVNKLYNYNSHLRRISGFNEKESQNKRSE
jgi:hypothetical protein